MNEDIIQTEHTLSKDTHVYVDNRRRTGLGVRKLDIITGNPIAGVRFHVWCSPKGTDGDMQDLGEHTTDKDGYILFDTANGKYLNEGWYKITAATGELLPDNAGLTSTNGIYTTDANRQIVLSHIKPGSYIITETKQLPGYSIDGETERTVVVQSDGIHTACFYNTPDGTLIVKKIDSVIKQSLRDVKFKIKTIIDADFETKSYTINEDGLITPIHLPIGTYNVIRRSVH